MDYCNFVVDLHGHTTRSDGNDTPAEFLQHAADRKMKIVAITDHDKVPPKTVTVDGGEQDLHEYAESLGLKVLPGTEISCETLIEDAHFVCFGCDFDAPFFRWLDEFTVRSKVESYQLLVKRLSELGMPMSWEEILENNGHPIAETEIQKKMIFNKMAEKGYVKDWSEGKKLVKSDEWLSINREKPDTVEVIHEIHRLGGIIIMAHPYLVAEQVEYRGRRVRRADFIDHLIYEGLDGIEARYTYDKTSYKGALTKEEIYNEVIQNYRDRLPVISGGSDYHADGKKGVLNPRDIGECGLTETEFYRNPTLVGLLHQ